MHQTPAAYFILSASFFLWSWGATRAADTLRQKETKAFWTLFIAVWELISCLIIMALMVVLAVAAAIKGTL
jgi:hypothetical protein